MAQPTIEEIQQALRIQQALTNPNIELFHTKAHSKASEVYIEARFNYPIGEPWKGLVPYWQPLANRFLETEAEIAAFLEGIYPLFSSEKLAEWVAEETVNGGVKFENAVETKKFFADFLSMDWVRPGQGLPNDNPNQAARIRDIKKAGYTIVADTGRIEVVGDETRRGHLYRLLPLPRHNGFKYENISPKLRLHVKKLFDLVDAYEFKKGPESTVLLDHKFPEIRWGNIEPNDNLEELDDEDRKRKFQLLSNQRNLEKRTVCHKCYNSGRIAPPGKRGIIAGINFFYEGDENWPVGVPQQGEGAEAGCKGCGWYDMQAWRTALNELAAKQREADSAPL